IEYDMAKPRVERAPAFDMDALDFNRIGPYLSQFGITDAKGRYLHWDRLKWRVPRDQAADIWQAIKLQRSFQQKTIPLKDAAGRDFHYCITPAMEAKLHQVVRTTGGNVGAVAGEAASDGIQEHFLVSALLMEEAITSAQLEGAATTREVAKKMLEEEREPVDEDERMILNNYLLLKEAERVRNEPLTVDQVLDFHRIATRGTTGNAVVPGELRLDDDIYVDDGDGGIAHQPPPFRVLPERLQALCDFANGDHTGMAGSTFIAPVVKAIILHFMIGYEHPFRDGNGRTARALFYWYMLKCDYRLFRYVSISRLLKDDPGGYGLSYLYSETDDNDLTYFIDFQLDIILRAFDDLRRYLETKSNDFQQIVHLLENTPFGNLLSFVQKDLIKKAAREPGRIFTAREVAKSYDITDNTARTHLNQLVDLKLLLATKDGRKVLYIAPADLQRRLGRKK
ncbi:Fic family protein, partial [Azotobacter chroococcum]|nr:Fic family protein [Azotobacter chroococcum]